MENCWAKLASRAARGMLARQDMSYAELTGELAIIGVPESPRAVEAKIIRGTFRFTFFLQALVASRADCPYQWAGSLFAEEPWQARTARVFGAEMAGQPWLSWRMLSSRLKEIGVTVEHDSLQAQLDSGSFSMTLFLQCATVCRFDSVYRFLDASSLNRAAVAGASAL